MTVQDAANRLMIATQEAKRELCQNRAHGWQQVHAQLRLGTTRGQIAEAGLYVRHDDVVVSRDSFEKVSQAATVLIEDAHATTPAEANAAIRTLGWEYSELFEAAAFFAPHFPRARAMAA